MDAEGLGRKYQETFKSELCPTKERYSVQIPIEVKEESAIFECKESICREKGNVSLGY